MILINLNAPRDITYRILDTDNIKEIEYIISFPSGYKYNFPVDLDRITGECIIHIPMMSGKVEFEFDGIGYIRIEKTDGIAQELEAEDISFAYINTVDTTKDCTNEVIFNEKLEPTGRMTLNMKDITISHSRTIDTIMANIDRNKK
jgi:hypothetical protein